MRHLIQIAAVCSILACAPRNYGEQGPARLSVSGEPNPAMR
jgi:hypothetical protein